MALVPAGAAAAQETDARDTDLACPDGTDDYPDFDDIAGSAHEHNVRCMAEYGLTRGLADSDNYGPRRDVTRGQMASFIARWIEHYIQEELDQDGFEIEESDDRFRDVPDGYEHAENIHKLYEIGVTDGTSASDGQDFAPQAPVTRAQMASFIARGASYIENGDARPEHQPPRTDDDYFPDDDGSVHEDNIDALADVGIVEGFEDDTYRPGDTVKRDQMASFIMRGYDWALATELGEAEVVSETFNVAMSWINEVDDSGDVPIFFQGDDGATGDAELTLTTSDFWGNPGTAAIDFTGENLSSGPSEAFDADGVGPLHLHAGEFDENGPVVIPFLETAADVTWDAGAETAEAEAEVWVDNDLIVEIIDDAEGYYLNYHTEDHPNPGAIRGQLPAGGQDLLPGDEDAPEAVNVVSSDLDTLHVSFTKPINDAETTDTGFVIYEDAACDTATGDTVAGTTAVGTNVEVEYTGGLGAEGAELWLQVEADTVEDTNSNNNPESDCLGFTLVEADNNG